MVAGQSSNRPGQAWRGRSGARLVVKGRTRHLICPGGPKGVAAGGARSDDAEPLVPIAYVTPHASFRRSRMILRASTSLISLCGGIG